jgi:hypothetical protein
MPPAIFVALNKLRKARVSISRWARLDPAELKLAKYNMSDQFSHQGEFIGAGVDQKATVIELLLQRAT